MRTPPLSPAALSYHARSYHALSYHALSYHAMRTPPLSPAALSYHARSYHAMRTLPLVTMPRYLKLRHTLSPDTLPFGATFPVL